MPKSGEHKVNYIDSFFRQRPSINSVREGETISFLEDGKLIKQEKRNGVVYQSEFAEAIPKLSTEEVEAGVIREIIAGAGLTGGGFSGEITLNVVGGTGITANANDIAIDSTVATLTGTQTLSNKTLASPTFTGTAQGANLTLTGDLTVGGTTTTLNAQNLQVKDKNIVLNYLDGDASSTADGAGITIQDAVNSITDATILWDNSSPTNSPGEFDFSHSINVTGNISLSGTVDGRDIATDGSKLDGIEALADVTDTTNVTAAGALMDSEVDADIKTLSLPASTTISSFAKTYLDDGDTTTFQSTIFGTTDVALGGQEKPRVVTLDYKTDSLTAIGSGDNFIIIDASDNYNLKVANFPTVLGTTGAINANEFARFTNSTTLEALTAAETVTALGLDDVPTVSSGSNDRIATFTGTSALQGESNLTFNSSNVLYVNGSVGIGATSPSASLEISKAGGEYLDLDISGISSGTSKLRFLDGGTAKFELRHFAGSPLLDANLSVYDHNTSSEALTVQVGGNVGIGTNSPASKLDLGGSTSGQRITFSNTGVNVTNGARTQAEIGYKTGSYSGAAVIKILTETAYDDSMAVAFHTGTSAAETMRIDSNQNVGIGTNNPSSLDATGNRLVVGGGSGDEGLTIFSGTTGRGTMLFADGNDGSNAEYRGWIQYEHANDSLEFATASAERMRINSSGNVGIGTAILDAGAKLNVVSGSSAYTAQFSRHDADDGLFLHSEAESTHYNWLISTQDNVDRGFEITPSTGVGNRTFSTPAFVIKADTGNVGIGVNSPEGKVHIYNGDASVAPDSDGDELVVENSGDSGISILSGESSIHTGSLIFGSANDAFGAGLQYSYYNNSLRLMTANTGHKLEFATDNNTTAMTIDSSQNVGIGTDSPDSKLQVEYTTTSNGSAAIAEFGTSGSGSIANSGHQVIVGGPSVSGYTGMMIYSDSTSGVGQISFADGRGANDSWRGTIAYEHANDRMEFWTNAAEKIAINSDGDFIPAGDGTQDLGSGSKRWGNVFSADLDLSNEGSQNDVDGTWGSYVIQEGEDDLFLINRRSGKKYKFMLQEVQD
jgi:hypothetical protein